jgi:hypothetical protein
MDSTLSGQGLELHDGIAQAQSTMSGMQPSTMIRNKSARLRPPDDVDVEFELVGFGMTCNYT